MGGTPVAEALGAAETTSSTSPCSPSSRRSWILFSAAVSDSDVSASRCKCRGRSLEVSPGGLYLPRMIITTPVVRLISSCVCFRVKWALRDESLISMSARKGLCTPCICSPTSVGFLSISFILFTASAAACCVAASTDGVCGAAGTGHTDTGTAFAGRCIIPASATSSSGLSSHLRRLRAADCCSVAPASGCIFKVRGNSTL
mmetsp:Transcript_11330/g.18970  ORF Transcript_11330/g.18970 Transcript_11330/m.18970 type:complete len:202 (+) Transcript_11330:1048-1653(+)